jgi:hypothetical protein
MMDVYHFEMETAYGIGMRRLLNRVVVGRGVICGLDVVRGDDPCSIVVTAGLAIDGWGREIIVPKDTAPIRLPKRLVDKVCRKDDEPCDDDTDQYQQQRDQQSGQSGDDSERDKGDHHDDHDQHDHHDHDDHDHHHDHDRDACLTVTLCYHECETDPVVVLAGDCGTSTPCAPGAIREQYRVGFEPGCTDPVELSCRFPDVLRHREIDHGALARWVTRGCPQPPRNPCIPLANVRLDCRDDGCAIDEIEIEVRPLVFGNGLILDMVSRIVEEMHSNEYGH